MSKILQDSTFFCLAISLIGYEIGIILRQKTKLALCNPLLISIVFVIIILKVTNIKYEVYEDGSSSEEVIEETIETINDELAETNEETSQEASE